MKKFFYLLSLLLCGTVLTACQNQPLTTSTESEVVENTETVEPPIEESSNEVVTDTPATQIQTGTILVSDGAGYTAEITIKVSQLIKGTDKEKLNHEWRYFGKEGEFEDLDLDPNTTVYLMGTVTYTNKTEGGFSLTGMFDGALGLDLYLFPDANDGIIMYSSPSRGVSTSGSLDIKPKIEKDFWGPVTFVLAKEGFFTPADPEGASHLQGAALKFINLGSKVVSDNFKKDGSFYILPITASW